MNNLPWSDCKIAFDIAYHRCDALWNDAGDIEWPAGWTFIESNAAGAGDVSAVFRVEGVPTVKDGETVSHLLDPYT